jgi:hypothetical protein
VVAVTIRLVAITPQFLADIEIAPVVFNSTVGGGYYNQCSSAKWGTIGGGRKNSCSNYYYQTIAGGYYNTCSGSPYGAVGGGKKNTASQTYATVSGGYYNANSGKGATIAGGARNTASGYYSFIGAGRYNTTTAAYSSAFGFQAKAVNVGQQSHASGRIAADGDAQHSHWHLSRQRTHSDATWWPLLVDGANSPFVPANTGWTFVAEIFGATVNQGKRFSFSIEGAISRDNASNTTLLASTTTTIYDTDDVSFDARAVANDTTEALEIQVQDSGSGGDTVRWSCYLRTTELTYA